MADESSKTEPEHGNRDEGATPSRGAGSIRPLAPLLVDQIAAGEVVERPSSVVKELVENALDAGASRIRVELKHGGLELISVWDNGSGIRSAELPLAVSPHATSKIREADDLERISTMGFRGEALASIASVSRLTIRSRSADSDAASILSVEGGQMSEVRPESGPVGTIVTVRHLFYNTPARRKFLRSQGAEQGRCVEAVRSQAMARPHVGFSVVCDEVSKLDLPADQSPRERVTELLGRELRDRLLEVNADGQSESQGVAVWGLVGLPEIARPTARGQRIFINGRPVQDRTIQHALTEAYRGLIEPSRRPTAALMIELDPAEVDVNTHPTKAEVRFRDSGLIHSVVMRTVRQALRAADLTPHYEMTAADRRSANPNEFGAGRSPRDAQGGQSSRGESVSPARFAQELRQLRPTVSGFDYQQLRAAVDAERAAALDADEAASRSTDEQGQASPQDSGDLDQLLPAPTPASPFLQVHNSYLVTQDEQGVVIIDQHALHERVMFELLMQRLSQGALESQRLLAPAVVETTPQGVDRLASLAETLCRLGIDASAIGPASVALHSFPTFLFEKRVDPATFVGELIERAEAEGFPADTEEAIREIVDMMACKAAIKAGNRLTEEESRELLAMRDRIDRSSNCPHGRPTTVRLSIRDLERAFGRT